MSFTIDRGLFKLDFTDHHAVLGIPVNADEKEVRKRYLKIARRLHPDSCKAGTEAEKKLANQLLSKLVNPAYEQLSQTSRDYIVSLGHMGRRLAVEKEKGKIPVASEAAKQLGRAGASLDFAYKSAVQNIASKQYESLDQVSDKIAEISELNLVYLMLKGSKGESIKQEGKAGTTTNPEPVRSKPPSPPPKPEPQLDSTASRVPEYIRRAEGYMVKNNFASAVLELREALKLDQTNSNGHSLLGIAYLKQNQMAMAKVHLNKALQLNPKEERAIKAKQYLDKLMEKNASTKSASSSKQPQSKPPENPSTSKSLFRNPFKKN
ncbi:DnaJ domain-containing protein [Microcoleus sp. FACHB-SPT15]|uniref:J domain-containing protein n=1 Tax=Microcoleus sp. FACHB-SPT15 TaxID=2692830 RepID=UPI00178166F8|nr:J domain-containing protein [Microcoleus sp. FACHB-SPT15]MBD1807572.1 DnaJ domain-containing protein [Microcoleus sp. FACHB-SPT15]